MRALLTILIALAALGSRATTASYYGRECAGLPMANGQPFDPDRLTCASWFYPLGTRLIVSNGRRSVTVTVTDRGPAKRLVRAGRKIDLSQAAMRRLDPQRDLIRVTIRRKGPK